VARNLTRTLYVLSVIPIVAGLATVILGADSVPAPNDAPANVESELRFYSVWWIGAGLFLAWLARAFVLHPEGYDGPSRAAQSGLARLHSV